MIRALELTRLIRTAWFSTGMPWSTSISQAARASAVISLGWLKCVTTYRGAKQRRSRASPSSIRIGRHTGTRVPMRIISTCGISAMLASSSSNLASDNSRGSPPDTSTSRISGWDRMYSIAERSSVRLSSTSPPLVMRRRGQGGARDGAAIEREQQHPVGVLVDDRRDGTPAVLPQRIDELTRAGSRFIDDGNRLHPHRAKRMVGIDERQVIRGDPQAKQSGGFLQPGALCWREENQLFERGGGADAISHLPAPVAPLGGVDLRKERLPAGRSRR